LRTAVGQRELRLEEYADGNIDSASPGKNQMDTFQAKLKGEKKEKKWKALSEPRGSLAMNWQPS
jgi:hypothetical protein